MDKKALIDYLANGVPSQDGWGGMPVGWGMRGNYGKSLSEHDDKYHGGHYDGTSRCRFRDSRARSDGSDRIPAQSFFDFGTQRRHSSPANYVKPHKFKVGPTVELKKIKDIGDDEVTPLSAGDFKTVMALIPDSDKIFAFSDVHEADYGKIDTKAHGTVMIAGDFSNVGFTSEASQIGMGEAVASGREWLNNTFFPMCRSRPNQKFVLIAGNHDHYLGDESADDIEWPDNVVYLKDSAAEINGMKVYGTPWCESKPWAKWEHKQFAETPFEVSAEECKEKYDQIPTGLDVLIVHQPPKDDGFDGDFSSGTNCGSKALADAIKRAKPKLVICGHMHEGDHRPYRIGDSIVMNCAHVSGRSDPSYYEREIGIIRSEDGDAGHNGFIIDGESDHKRPLPKAPKFKSFHKPFNRSATYGRDYGDGHKETSSIYWFQ